MSSFELIVSFNDINLIYINYIIKFVAYDRWT